MRKRRYRVAHTLTGRYVPRGKLMMKRDLINCNSVEYRKGFIEVIGDIHNECINVEVWNIHPDIDISGTNLDSEKIKDEYITANTEIELSIQNTEVLIKKLQKAIEVASSKKCT